MTSAVTIAVQIISQESGIAIDELTDDARFEDIGLDSLLSLVVSSRIRDELEIEFESSIFLELNTVGSFKTYLRGLAGQTEETTTVTESVKEEVIPIIDGPLEVDVDNSAAIWKGALDIIAEESLINVAELTSDTSFSDIGVDSLLSLVICSRLRDELELDISDKSLFMEFTTIESLRKHITGSSETVKVRRESSGSLSSINTPSSTSSPSSVKDFTGTPDTESLDTSPSSIVKARVQDLPPVKPAWSITLQGSSKRATERLFLFPDGCGAATSYVNLPKVSPSTAVIGFNSPFMR